VRSRARPPRSSTRKDIDFLLVGGEIFALIVYGQLFLKTSSRGSPREPSMTISGVCALIRSAPRRRPLRPGASPEASAGRAAYLGAFVDALTTADEAEAAWTAFDDAKKGELAGDKPPLEVPRRPSPPGTQMRR
jgi:hypothetical protein